MYEALYRKWRPLTFDDVISQPHITRTLKNQLQSGKTAHAYLFTGARGTGKTTCARILAKALNCEALKDGNPCLSCGVCEDADRSALNDIIEIDAASNNGVGDVRELRDAAAYLPERCRCKVYIIDEVHMLSVSAFNALLKLMEEPPPYLKFILATTEIHKVPATIISRCQRFDFRRIRLEDIAQRLRFIAQHEQLSLSEDASLMLARLSDGGMRDAISLLDQCAGYSSEITVDSVAEATGAVGRETVFSILDAFADQNAASALSIVDQLYCRSKDILVLCSELLMQLRNVMLLQTLSDPGELLSCMSDELSRLKALAERFSPAQVLNLLSDLQLCATRLHQSVNQRAELEVCLIRLCNLPKNENPLDNSEIYDRIKKLEDRIGQLERQSAGGIQSPPLMPRQTAVKPFPAAANPQQQEGQPVPEPSKLSASDFSPVQLWPEIVDTLSKVNPAVSGALTGSAAFAYENLFLVVATNPFFLTLFRTKEHADALGDAIEQVLGKRYTVRVKCKHAATETMKPAEALIQKAKNSQIDVAVE